jgi:TonB family protein
VPPAALSEKKGLASASEVPTAEEIFRSAVPDKSPPIQGPYIKEADMASSIVEASSYYSERPHFDTTETLSQRIANELSTNKEYPPAALKRKTEGIVKLSLDVAPNGSLIRVKIQTPSGSAILDEAALKLVQSIFPLDVKLASSVSLIVPVEYRILK